MKHYNTPFTGQWRIAAVEFNTAGHWHQEYVPASDDWTICFGENGHYKELERGVGGACHGNWTMDEWGIITIHYDSDLIDKCVFREEGRGTYLYMYDDLQHIAPDPAVIVKYHAFSRYRIEKLDPSKAAAATVGTAATAAAS